MVETFVRFVGVQCHELDLTFDLAMVNLSLKILSGLYLRNCKVQEVDTWYGDCYVGVQCHDLSLTLP